MSTIAILSNVIPTPKNAPGSPHLFYLAQEWAKQHRLVLICHCPKSEIDPSIAEQYWAIEFLPEFPPPSLAGRIRHRLQNAAYFSQKYRNPNFLKELQQRLEKLILFHQASHLHVAQLSASELIPQSLEADQVTVDITDDPSLLYLRDAALSTSSGQRKELKIEAAALGKFMQQLAQKNYQMFVVGKEDQMHLATRWGVKTNLAPLGIDTEYYRRNPSVQRELTAVFTGVMNYLPNIETAQYFAERILPLVRSSYPSLRFLIVGANPTEEVQRLAELPGVEVTGTVPDVRPYLSSAQVFVSPMRSGAGIKNKILAAMAIELPIVASPLGVAGIEVKDGVHCLLTEDADEFAEKVAVVLAGGETIEKMVKTAHEFVVTHHAWPAMAKQISQNFHSTLPQQQE